MVCHVSITLSSGGDEAADFQKKRIYPLLHVNTTLCRNSRILRRYCGKTIKDRGLSFGTVPTHIQKAKLKKSQLPPEVSFSDTRFSNTQFSVAFFDLPSNRGRFSPVALASAVICKRSQISIILLHILTF